MLIAVLSFTWVHLWCFNKKWLRPTYLFQFMDVENSGLYTEYTLPQAALVSATHQP